MSRELDGHSVEGSAGGRGFHSKPPGSPPPAPFPRKPRLPSGARSTKAPPPARCISRDLVSTAGSGAVMEAEEADVDVEGDVQAAAQPG